MFRLHTKLIMKHHSSNRARTKRTCNSLLCLTVLALVSSALLGETDEKTGDSFNLRTTTGYQSNIFEVNDHIESPTGSWFQETTLDAQLPIDGKEGGITGKLDGEWKAYFGHSEIDEYLIKPGLDFRVFDGTACTLNLDLHAARLRERIYSQFTSVPAFSEPGWSVGTGWKLERKLPDEDRFIWNGGVGYKWYDSVPFDNVVVSTKAEFQRNISGHLEWTAATKWDFQHYRQRPPDLEPPGTPLNLSTLEGRAITGISWKPGGGLHAEIEVNGGCNLDLTNGYYDAGVVAVKFEIGWESDDWKMKLSAEPEWVSFRNRPANLEHANINLFTQEYVVEAEVQYELTKNISFFAAAGIHLQGVNSDEARPDATLNRFNDYTARIGVACSF